MKTRRDLTVRSGSVYPEYRAKKRALVTPQRLQIAKWQSKQLFKDGLSTAKVYFRNFALRKYRCKRSQITFDDKGALRRLENAILCDDHPDMWGQTDGKQIEICECEMCDDLLVGTLLHESLHDWCRVRGKVMSCRAEHYCMAKCGDPNEFLKY